MHFKSVTPGSNSALYWADWPLRCLPPFLPCCASTLSTTLYLNELHDKKNCSQKNIYPKLSWPKQAVPTLMATAMEILKGRGLVCWTESRILQFSHSILNASLPTLPFPLEVLTLFLASGT